MNNVHFRIIVDSDLSGDDLSCLEIRRVCRSTSQEEPTHQEDPNMLACSLVARQPASSWWIYSDVVSCIREVLKLLLYQIKLSIMVEFYIIVVSIV